MCLEYGGTPGDSAVNQHQSCSRSLDRKDRGERSERNPEGESQDTHCKDNPMPSQEWSQKNGPSALLSPRLQNLSRAAH